MYTLQVNHRGNLMPDGSRRGDLIIEVLVENESADGMFKRLGDNLSIILDVHLRETILGYGNRPVFKHLDGEPVNLSRIPGSALRPGS